MLTLQKKSHEKRQRCNKIADLVGNKEPGLFGGITFFGITDGETDVVDTLLLD